MVNKFNVKDTSLFLQLSDDFNYFVRIKIFDDLLKKLIKFYGLQKLYETVKDFWFKLKIQNI
jgi:hypothetical protein